MRYLAAALLIGSLPPTRSFAQAPGQKVSAQPEPMPDEHGLYRIGGAVKPPVVLYQPEPRVPPLPLKLDFRPGSTLFYLIVKSDGTPADIRILRSGGRVAPDAPKTTRKFIHDYDQAGLEAVHHYRFRPALLNGKPVPVAMNVEVNVDYF